MVTYKQIKFFDYIYNQIQQLELDIEDENKVSKLLRKYKSLSDLYSKLTKYMYKVVEKQDIDIENLNRSLAYEKDHKRQIEKVLSEKHNEIQELKEKLQNISDLKHYDRRLTEYDE